MVMSSIYMMLLLVSSLAAAADDDSAAGCRGNTGTVMPIFLAKNHLFCGGGAHGSSPTCCTAEDDLKLHQMFLNELLLGNNDSSDDLKLHQMFLNELLLGNNDSSECSSWAALKAKICQVCLPWPPSAPGAATAAEPLTKTTAASMNNSDSSALAPPLSISVHDLASPSTTKPPPTIPEPDWLLADDNQDNKAWTTPTKLLVGILSALAGLLGGFAAYKVFKARLECFTNCHINCCICLPETTS